MEGAIKLIKDYHLLIDQFMKQYVEEPVLINYGGML